MIDNLKVLIDKKSCCCTDGAVRYKKFLNR